MTGWLVAREKCISTFKWQPSGAVSFTAAAAAFYRPSTDSIQQVLSQILLGGCLEYDRWKGVQRNSTMIEFKGSHFERDVILWGSAGMWRGDRKLQRGT
ncbi:MAG TPA: hypothetical protein VLZ74_06365 [Methylocella sp.]|nr:hypothetical protein [Methylocella sp.]